MTDHTPGPWYDVAFYGNHSIGSVDVRVAEVVLNGVYDLKGEANARLIAAAPDLLEALYLLVRDKDRGMRFSERIRHAEAAIAKATGGL